MVSAHDYEGNYANLPFEDKLREYRKRKTLEVLTQFPHHRILEIGSGPIPLFAEFNEFTRMVVVEPGDQFFEAAHHLAGDDPRITVIHDRFEKVADLLSPEVFDVIIIGGFLHEIDSPDEVIRSLKRFCKPGSIVHSYVPNAKSFHRLLALEMGLIPNVYMMSNLDVLFQRRTIYDTESFRSLFQREGMTVLELGSYFVKPFTHEQMDGLVQNGVMNDQMMDGLDRMIGYMPGLGAELYAVCTFDSDDTIRLPQQHSGNTFNTMKLENIHLGQQVIIDSTTSINNIVIGDHVRIAQKCNVFGGPGYLLEIGEHTYIGMRAFIEGYNAKVIIGSHVSIAPRVSIVSGSGPNASAAMQRVMPIQRAPIHIGDHCWIGTGAMIAPGVTLGKYCVVGVNSFVNASFPDFSIIGGTPARLIREFSDEEKKLLLNP